ncbi:hypothetical protein A6A40_24255 (plasmid) [Azospirillum humicireducens]|uniref:TfuA-like core domain-containing protein n=1 Tax=Azospirillum humicireducens TaxID=1226968 RepID=A0A2R4VUP2_9PROT|nr:TfuA-like protein [Azospirillum humicireducens]AWB08144.1 hypothetical protein A6A40_24255 [Azospirillum humicireducens]
MKVVVFLGPSLPTPTARAVLDADFRPPVSQGDVYRAVQDGAHVIGIIDGFFERIPAVWHKEILWALTQGVHVFGAASMGALRAAELADFGMIGVGRIFTAFRDGILDDDDEVAIVHGPADLEYPTLSEAMVNIRATLDRAVEDAVIGGTVRDQLLIIAKSLHFPQRNYERIFAIGTDQGREKDIGALRRWLPTGRLDIKHDDALSMLHAISDLLAHPLEPKTTNYPFVHTDTWERMIRQMEPASSDAAQEDLLEELRLNPMIYDHIMDLAMARALALRDADRQGVTSDAERFDETLNGYFVRRNLVSGPDIQSWMADQELDAAGLTTLIEHEQRIDMMKTLLRSDVHNAVPESLRVSGRFGVLSRRVRDKRRWLAENGLEGADLSATGLSEKELVFWHFRTRLGIPVPVHLDTHIRALGLENRRSFLQALARDYLYSRRGVETDQSLFEKGLR